MLVYGKYQLLDRENPEVYAYTRSLEGRTLMVALSFSPAGGRTALPPGYTSGRILINNLAGIAGAGQPAGAGAIPGGGAGADPRLNGGT